MARDVCFQAQDEALVFRNFHAADSYTPHRAARFVSLAQARLQNGGKMKPPSTPTSTYAVTLYFDPESTTLIRSAISHLAEICGNDYMIQNEVPPHLTLGMFHASDADLEKLENLFRDFSKKAGRTFPVDFSGADSFMDKVIFLSLKKDSPTFTFLKDLNSSLHEMFIPHFEAGDNRNYLPQNWVPHIALAVKLSHSQFEKGISLFEKSILPQSAKVISLGLARCNPYKEILRISLSTDSLSAEQRHKNMAAIHSLDTKPEKKIRSALFKFGLRFRKNDRRYPGTPDLVFPHYHAVVFINGCFWHGHESCSRFRIPKSNVGFWENKIERNKKRDSENIKKYQDMSWRVCVVWECAISGKKSRQKIKNVTEKICLWLEECESVFLEIRGYD